jgi:plastocyanin
MKVSNLLAIAAALMLVPAAAMAESIEGTVDVTGTIPPAGKLHREADPFCAKKPMNDPSTAGAKGHLENVWVHVSKGAKDATPPADVVEMDQKDCMYVPRMTVAVVGQKIQAKNGDPILHNVHTYLGASTLFNKGMPNDKAAPIETTASAEGMMKWKCDVHPWMRGYIGISKSGLQAISKEDGSFTIANVPPGKYTVESWHEKFGSKTQEVTVEAGKPAKITFKYDASKDKA